MRVILAGWFVLACEFSSFLGFRLTQPLVSSYLGPFPG